MPFSHMPDMFRQFLQCFKENHTSFHIFGMDYSTPIRVVFIWQLGCELTELPIMETFLVCKEQSSVYLVS